MAKGLNFLVVVAKQVPQELRSLCAVTGMRKFILARDCEAKTLSAFHSDARAITRSGGATARESIENRVPSASDTKSEAGRFFVRVRANTRLTDLIRSRLRRRLTSKRVVMATHARNHLRLVENGYVFPKGFWRGSAIRSAPPVTTCKTRHRCTRFGPISVNSRLQFLVVQSVRQ